MTKKLVALFALKRIQPIFEKNMIFQLLFFEFCAAFCVAENRLFSCADTVGYLIFTKAQERVNWLLGKTNDSMEPMRLNCTEHIRSSQNFENYAYSFSKENNDACNYASLVFEKLLQKYSLPGILPIECEFAPGFFSSALLQNKKIVSGFYLFFATIFVGVGAM